jgi:hypothetical protein
LALGEIEAALRRIRLCVEVAEDLAELLTVALGLLPLLAARRITK